METFGFQVSKMKVEDLAQYITREQNRSRKGIRTRKFEVS